MKFVTYQIGRKNSIAPQHSRVGGRLGFTVGDAIVDLQNAHLRYALTEEAVPGQIVVAQLPNDILTFLEDSEFAMLQARKVEKWAQSHLAELKKAGVAYDQTDISLLAPIPHPSSMRDAYAFRQHVEAARRNRGLEMIPEFDQFPVFYFTNHQAVVGPGPIQVMPEHLKHLDFELEAAVVIGKECRNIKASDADSYIFGYMVMNDWSARTMQMEEMKLSLGPAKGKDFATAIGPYLVTVDELKSKKIESEHGDRYDLAMTCRMNGKEYSRGNLKDMTWTFAQIIERVSYGVTIYPGDVIGSGTVGTGCFLELNGSKITDDLWVQTGDEVTCAIEELGSLTNVIVEAR